ncbi:MAG: DUF2589 domain-containing protein [Candidatus Methanoperedens sp.]
MTTNPGTELAALDFGNLIGGPLEAVIKAQSNAAQETSKFIKEVGFYPAGTKAMDGTTDIGGSPIYVDFKYPKEIQPYQPAIAGAITSPAIGEPSHLHGMKKPDGTAPAGNTDPAIEDNDAPHPDGLPVYAPAGSGGTPPAVGEPSHPHGMKKPDGTAPAGNTDPAIEDNDVIHPNGLPVYQAQVTANGSSAVPAVYQEMKISVPILTMLPIPFIKVDIITIDFNAKINSMETSSSTSETDLSGSLSAGYGGKRAHVSFTGSASYKRSNASGSSVERTYSMAIHVQASQDEMPAGMEKLLNILEGAMKSTPGNILPPTTT